MWLEKLKKHKIWKIFKVTDFNSLMFPCFFICGIIGYFPYKWRRPVYLFSKTRFVISTFILLLSIFIWFNLFYQLNFTDIIKKNTTEVIHENMYALLIGIGIITMHILSGTRLCMIQNLLKISSILSEKDFNDLAKRIHKKDILGFLFILIHLPNCSKSDIHVTLRNVTHLYILFINFSVDMLYINCIWVLKVCFKKLNKSIHELKKFRSGNDLRVETIVQQKNSLLLIKLKHLEEKHLEISDVVQLVNDTFIIHIIVLVITTFTTITFNLYFFLLKMYSPKTENIKFWFIPNLAPALFFFIKFAMIIWICESTTNEAKKIKWTLYDAFSDSTDPMVRREVHLFSLQIMHRNNKFTAKTFDMNSVLLGQEEKIRMLRFGSILGVLVFLTIAKIVISNRCLTMLEDVNPKRVIHLDGQPLNINFEVSRRVTQRLATIIMKIFLTEVLGYSKVSIYEKEDEFRAEETFSRLSDDIMFSSKLPMVNMEVWIPPHLDTMPLLNSHEVKECGSIAPPGRFGWFVPTALSRRNDNWIIFTELEKASRFEMDESTLESIRNFTIDPKTSTYYCQESYCQQGMYIPEWCQGKPCALLLTSYIDVTNFVKDHIDQMKLYVNVIWFGPNLKHVIKLAEELMFDRNSSTSIDRSLVFLHWTPSTVIPNERDFVSIDFPRCGATSSEIGCKYESNRLTKLVWARLEYAAKLAYEAINRAKFTREMYEDLIDRRNRDSSMNEEEIACDWLRENLNYTLDAWMPNTADKNILYVGGIFPMSETFYSGKAILVAAMMAKEAINVNNTILRDYNFTLLVNDGQCKSDMVMRSFINYIVHNQYEKLVGVLGPACSETVEPLVGVSKHYKTVVISYSAEGSSFNDRTKYPYFFRTIGENKQYKHVYLQLLKKLGWKRVASLTEDGQKYTEYISYMQDLFRDNGIVFVANAKFPREREPIVMTKYLQDFKQKKAKIIIADVYDQAARQVMCNAYKLEMTAVQGYVWFLPLWLRPEWYDTDRYNQKGEQVPCTTAEMSKAINGYLGLSHAYFAPDNDIMQEGITVRQWRDRYELQCQNKEQPPSNYAGYAYDAMWTYAYAMDRLLRENQSYVFDLHSNHTINRLTDIIGETDFYGVSGRIKFFGGPSRYSVINIVQHVNNETRLVGNFYPNVSEKQHEVAGGKLDLNVSSLVWLSKSMPDDGSEPPQRCVIGGFADFINVSCEVAFVIVNIIGFTLLGIFLIIGFLIIKQRYERKVREQREYLKSMGISYACDDSSDLDKWEIPRHRVVINRKLGEGAFGTVYGGEAFFPEKGWLAVAVKTLKIGSSTEEKLDFLSEVEVMKQFEHKNIIKLLGVCIKSEPVLTVMEFMLYGDLKTYLLARRHLVNDNSYEDSDEISNKKLTAMALDVARALSYLAQSKYVHRDIASRNCLVNAQRVVKLGDFGMTRLMYENDYYKFNRRGMLPVRWMAPESLGLGIFSPASDVWSYGVLLYEIITFGSFPFQGMSNIEVLNHVKSGNSLMVPKGVKIQLENLMYSCWRLDHIKRPTAPEIVEFLATNPRILSPCLDVPLASVQIEHTGQLDIELPENLRKFSLSWSPQNSTTRPASTSSPFGVPYPPLLDINDHDDKPIQNSIMGNGIADAESSRPLLLNANEPLSGLPMILQSFKQKEESPHKYVNIQPGISNNCDYSSDQNGGGSIQMEERRAILPENRKSEDVSIL